MKKSPRAFILSAAFLAAFGFTAVASEWSSDYAKSIEQARTEKKQVLLDFTGSDWCGWCIKLDKEVFSKPAFKEYAKKNLVLVEVDFPRNKHLAKTVKDQNDKLAAEHGIQGYPTIVVLNSDGKKVGELGYMEGGPDAFIAALEKLPKS